MALLSRERAKQLFAQHRKHRDGIRNIPEMASVCLICGSMHVDPVPGDVKLLVCRNCGFAFHRYVCRACGEAIDGRDPNNPGCPMCHDRLCTCGTCSCTLTQG